jgi:hypothetical protein
MLADATTAGQVMTALERYRDAYIQRDLPGLLACLAPEDDLMIIGTGVDERMVGWDDVRAQYERDWAQADEITWEWGRSTVSAAGEVAWVTCDSRFDARMGAIRVGEPVRLTAVLARRGEQWLICQLHVSIAAQERGESFPLPHE